MPAPLCISSWFQCSSGLRPESAAHRNVEQGPRLRGCDREGARESRGFGAPSVALRGRIQAKCAWNLLRPPRDASLRDLPIFPILPASSASPAPILAATPNNMRTNHLRIMWLARVLAHGIVESPLLRMTKQRAFLRALSQNRDSASRVSLRYGL